MKFKKWKIVNFEKIKIWKIEHFEKSEKLFRFFEKQMEKMGQHQKVFWPQLDAQEADLAHTLHARS